MPASPAAEPVEEDTGSSELVGDSAVLAAGAFESTGHGLVLRETSMLPPAELTFEMGDTPDKSFVGIAALPAASSACPPAG